MKAWRFYAVDDMRLDEVPAPNVQPGWVLVRVRVTQPSVTEVIRARGWQTLASDFIHTTIAEQAPVQLLGHEFCGEIVDVGEGVTELTVGTRVANARSRVPCYQCEMCRSGQPDLCRRGPSLGLHIPGSFAELVALPAEMLIALPDAINDNVGACMQPLTSCVALVESSGIAMGDTIVVWGQGAMGLGILQIVRASGAGRVITIDVRDEALAMSMQLGADATINATKNDPSDAILDLTNGRGADIVFEAAGGSRRVGLAGTEAILGAFDAVRDAGKVVPVAMLPASVDLDLNALRKRSLKLLFPDYALRTATMQHTLHLLSTGRLRVMPAITHILHGLDALPQALEITGNKTAYRALNPAQIVV